MSEILKLTVNGKEVAVPPGVTVSTAVMLAGFPVFRRSVSGEPRGPLCGMGICGECHVTIDGRAHERSCRTLCRSGMEVVIDE